MREAIAILGYAILGIFLCLACLAYAADVEPAPKQYCEWAICKASDIPSAPPINTECTTSKGLLDGVEMAVTFVQPGKNVAYTCWPISQAKALGKIEAAAK